jgi:DNA-binding beta-propeller fold protein YncE
MSAKFNVVMATAVAALTFSGAAGAAELKKIAEIPVPGEPLASFDISFLDQASQRFFLADRSNKAVDIFDAKENKFLGRVAGFVGAVVKDGRVDNAHSGPNGVLAFGDEAWAGDGDSTIKVIDLKAMKIVDTISTGGKGRANEMTYDPKDEIFIIGNQNEEPPFTTMVSTKSGHRIIGKVMMPDATDGNEQPQYNPADGLVYQPIPILKHDTKKGGIAVIDPRSATLLKTLEVDNCSPNGIAFGPNDNFVLGCTANGTKMDKAPPIIAIMNTKTGKLVANVPDIGGADEVAYSKKNNQYYVPSRLPDGITLGVIDAATNKLVQKIAIKGGNPHSVAVNDNDGHVFVPVGIADGGCGCIQVYALQ